jgi:hypothetical protein
MTAPVPRSSRTTLASGPTGSAVRTPDPFLAGAACLALLLGGALARPAAAGPNGGAKIQLHVRSLLSSPCTAPAARPACADIVTSGTLYAVGHYVHLLVTDGHAGAGISSLECSVDYANEPMGGVDVFGFTGCGTLVSSSPGVYGPWPSARSHVLIEWPDPNCQQIEPGTPGSGVVANAGYFYVSAYTADDLRIIPSPVSGVARVTSCAAVVDTVEGGGVVRVPSHLGSARFSAGGTEPGYSPCGLATPVRPTTWGRIKATYRGLRATEMREQ